VVVCCWNCPGTTIMEKKKNLKQIPNSTHIKRIKVCGSYKMILGGNDTHEHIYLLIHPHKQINAYLWCKWNQIEL